MTNYHEAQELKHQKKQQEENYSNHLCIRIIHIIQWCRGTVSKHIVTVTI